MKRHFIFRLKEGSTVDEALEELELLLSDLYETIDTQTEQTQIGGYTEEDLIPEQFMHVVLDHSTPLEECNWEEQWETFAPNFHHGLAHVNLTEYGGPALLLKPGGGFGDFSHPTTRLTLSLMAPCVKHKTVFDIGCGSGILTIAAVLLGATRAYGIDIEESALQHSRENAKLNQVQQKVLFCKTLDPSWLSDDTYVILMNMIESEQQTAWQASRVLHAKKAIVITSGILASSKKHYLELTSRWHWTLIDEKEEEGWMGFVFTQNL